MSTYRLAFAGLASLALSAPAFAAQKVVPFTGTADIQQNLIAQFPVGKFVPPTSFTPAVTFTIPKAFPKKTPPKYNFWAGSGGTSLTLNVSYPRATHVYTLMNAYSPPSGQTIATVELKGSKGADQVVSFVAGADIRDFCVNEFANAINGTTTQNAFEVDNVQGACGTGNVKTGLVADYHIDEQQITLIPAFKKQKLTQIIITPTGVSGSSAVLLGVTVAR